jgi:hypothetical protein
VEFLGRSLDALLHLRERERIVGALVPVAAAVGVMPGEAEGLG